MSDDFQGVYEVGDGYIGKARPRHFRFYACDVEDDMSDDELLEMYEQAAQEDFEQNITCDTMNRDEFLEWAKSVQAERAAG